MEHIASRVEIIQTGHVVQTNTPLATARLMSFSHRGEAPAPGRYVLHWQVRSVVDGTVSDTSIPFSVESQPVRTRGPCEPPRTRTQTYAIAVLLAVKCVFAARCKWQVTEHRPKAGADHRTATRKQSRD